MQLSHRKRKRRKIKPVGLENWPKGTITNCLGFAIGYTESLRGNRGCLLNLDSSFEIGTAFAKKMWELGYEVPRRIRTISDAQPNEYVVAVYGFYYYKYWELGHGWVDEDDFHLIRRELDGTWVHKEGWRKEPEIVTEKIWTEIECVYGNNPALFAFEACEESDR